MTLSFIGDLHVVRKDGIKGIEEKCNTQVIVKSKFNYIFKCAPPAISSARIDVQINQSVSVLAEYLPLSTSGTFYHCLGFREMLGTCMLVQLSLFMVIIGFFVVLYNYYLTDLFSIFLFYVTKKMHIIFTCCIKIMKATASFGLSYMHHSYNMAILLLFSQLD